MSKEINVDGYRLAHTMIRVRNLEASFNFYCKTLGMKVLRKTDYPDGRFTNAFIGYGLETESPCLELTHIWDQSGVVALEQIIRKFQNGGSKVEIVGLNKESLNLFERLGGLESAH